MVFFNGGADCDFACGVGQFLVSIFENQSWKSDRIDLRIRFSIIWMPILVALSMSICSGFDCQFFGDVSTPILVPISLT